MSSDERADLIKLYAEQRLDSDDFAVDDAEG
jgi:hypothetical protein